MDKTRIAVRERATPEVLDLTLHVMWAYAWPLLVTMLFGVVPLMLLNQLLLGWLLQPVEFGASWSPEEFGWVTRYVVNMSLLVAIEAPLASVFATAFLGQAVFLEQPRIREVLRDLAPLAPRLAWCHLIVRGILPAWILLALIDRDSSYSGWEGLLIMLTIVVLALRAFRPFLNEIVILERLPLRKSPGSPMTIGLRGSFLQGPASGDLFVRWIVSASVACLLVIGVYGVLLFLSGVLLHQWRPTPLLLQLCLPLSMWAVAGFMGVFRFLSYLDLRIRHEGWEVELRLRAEATRLMSKMV